MTQVYTGSKNLNQKSHSVVKFNNSRMNRKAITKDVIKIDNLDEKSSVRSSHVDKSRLTHGNTSLSSKSAYSKFRNTGNSFNAIF